MKEAAGEANITVITIVLIALVLVVGTVVVRSVLLNAKMQSACTAFGGEKVGNQCKIDGTSYNIIKCSRCATKLAAKYPGKTLRKGGVTVEVKGVSSGYCSYCVED